MGVKAWCRGGEVVVLGSYFAQSSYCCLAPVLSILMVLGSDLGHHLDGWIQSYPFD